MLVDFHCHTFESDGTLSPFELTAAMKRRGVGIFSITDHDTLGAYDALRPGGTDDPQLAPMQLIAGIEINTTYRGNEVHVLGYGFEPGPGPLQTLVEENRVARNERAAKMVEQLQAAGYEITFDRVLAEASGGSVAPPLGRPHVAKALVRMGAVSDVATVFQTLLTHGKPGYVPSHHVRPHDAVATIAKAGGVPVLAHPGRLKDESLIEELAEAGIVGLEVFYPTHSASQISHYRETAARLGLVMTAGSDFHDARWNVRGVGMEVEEDDIRPFLDLVL